jgi:predicted small metal-binding protein
MSNFYLVCKKRLNGSKCSETISAESKEELMTAALAHASSVHGLSETRGLRDEYRMRTKKGAPPA